MKFITLGTGAGTPSKTRNNSSAVLVTSNGAYVVDAGGPLTALLIRKDIDLNNVRAVFISHMHEDHFGGLPGFLKDRMRYALRKNPAWKIRPEIWLPDPDAGKAFEQLMEVQFRGRNKDMVQFCDMKSGLFYDDGYLKVSAVPNRHIIWDDGSYLPSFCLVFEAEGKKMVYTGDLASDCSDFPVDAAKDADLCVAELTHFELLSAAGYFRQIKPGKLVFNHVGTVNSQKVPEFRKLVDYPVFVAEDGDEFEF